MKLIALTILLITLSLPALAQEETQLGIRFQAGDTTVSRRTAGVAGDIIIGLGDHVATFANVGFKRLPIDSGTNVHIFETDGDLRFSPFSRSGFHFFGGAGLNFQRLTNPAQSINFVSPTVLGGVGFGRFGHAAYRHAFKDLTSSFDQRFDQIEANAYIPMAKSKWRGKVGASYRRSHLSNFTPGPFDYTTVTFYLGVGRVLGNR